MFTWDETKCDNEIYNGQTVMICCIENKVCNQLIKDLSNKIGYKLDYHNAAGRNVIKCKNEDYDSVIEKLADVPADFYSQYGMDEAGYIKY
jgi:hypothetical protein